MTIHSEQLISFRITISAWRQIAVAIARQYLGSAFGTDKTGNPKDDEDHNPKLDNRLEDLQVSHGLLVAGIIYAQELSEATFRTMQAWDKFRAVSQAWHRFLGFRTKDQKLTVGAKRRQEPYKLAQNTERIQRLRLIQTANIKRSLQSIIGPNAAFQGQQEKVIQAIMHKAGPFVQITGTGGGKSLLFMLPAYYVPSKTTIAIVPLVSLQEDLHSQCKSYKIQTIT